VKKTLIRLNELVYKTELFIGVTMLLAIVFLVFMQVFNRFILKQPLSWSEELARYLFIILVFIGISVATKARAHFGIDFFLAKLSPSIQKLVGIGTSVVILVFLWVIFSKSFILINSAMAQKSPAMGITVGNLYYTFTIFAVFCSIHVLTNLIEDLFKENAQ